MKSESKPQRVGSVRPGARVIIQKCKKCGLLTESDGLLISCPTRKPLCDGLMTPELDYYFEDAAEKEGNTAS